jgi:membrane protease subunit HflC
VNRLTAAVVAVVAAIVLVYMGTCFSVGEWQQALVLKFGKPMRTIVEPGLNFRIPFVHQVVYFDKRLMEYDAAPRELITRDKQQLVVDNFSRWKIIDPLKFYQTVLTEAGAQSRLDDIIYSNLREAIGQVTSTDVVSGDRTKFMDVVRSNSDRRAAEYGIKVVDVRIKRTDLPEKNEQNVFRRMRTERERLAKKFRAEGDEASSKIRSQAEREKRVIMADANRESEIIRGKADALATDVYAKAYGRDAEFYGFIRTLESWRKTLGEQTTVVLTPSSEFLELLVSSRASSRKR